VVVAQQLAQQEFLVQQIKVVEVVEVDNRMQAQELAAMVAVELLF